MCTVSWVHHPGGYHLLMNRDEKRTRAAGFGPRIEARGGTRYIAPADGDFGGTWLAVNEFGITVCLLNGAGPRCAAARSRGFVVPELIGAESAAGAALALRQLDLTPYAPFTLAILEPDACPIVSDWDGRVLAIDGDAALRMPLISSSFDPDAVRARRLAEFQCRTRSGRIDSAVLYWFHASHGLQAGPYSTCMHRPDAETVSFSWVTVNSGHIRFFYSPAAPCRVAAGEQQILGRAA